MSGSRDVQPAGALDGVRVLDFTWSVAGPVLTRNLAILGAEILKVEWPAHADPMRSAFYAADATYRGFNNGPFFADLNVGKKSLTVDVRSPEGAAVVTRLLEQCDLVVESFSSRVFERWGFGYEQLSAINPSIVYVSISGFGHSGPNRDWDTWGPTAQAYNGLTHQSGLPGREPAGWGWSYMDLAAGYTATVATIAALLSARATGVGQYVDISQIESGIALNGAAILDATVNERAFSGTDVPIGNRSVVKDASQNGGTQSGYRGDEGVPYGIYPTKGGGYFDYCAVTACSDEQWFALRRAMGDPPWSARGDLDNLSGRIESQDEIDEEIASWSMGFEKYELMEYLQGCGVAAGAVQSAEDKMESDPQLFSSNLWPYLTHPEIGRHRFQGVPFSMSPSPTRVEERWPILGSDTASILEGVLNMSAEEVADLEARGITWPAGMGRDVDYGRELW